MITTGVPTEQGIILAAILFAVGLAGVLTRRNMIFMLLSVEIMLNSAGLAFVVAGSAWGQADGQVMFLFILAVAAAEVAVGLALLLSFFKRHKDLNTDSAKEMKG